MRHRIAMRDRMMKFAAAIVSVGALWLPLSGGAARAQPAPAYVNVVDLDIAPASFQKFMAALKVNADASIKEPGVREFNIAVSQKNPHHVFIVEVYNNAAAYDAHQKTAHYNKFLGQTFLMIQHYNIRPFAAVSMNTNGAAPTGPAYINAVELDIVPAQIDKFTAAAKDDATAAMQEPGCREFDIAASQGNRHHLLFFEVYDNADAFAAHQASDHFKAYQAATASMVTKRETTPMSAAALARKGG